MSKNINVLPVGWCWIKHDQLSEINPKTSAQEFKNDLEVSFIPMRAVDEVSGKFDLSATRTIGKVIKGYTSFIDGDIIFAKITPCMENGKIALLKDLKNGIGFGSTEFHVSRLTKYTNKKFIFFYFVQASFRSEARRNMTGSAGQLRVPSGYFKNVKIPVPPLPEQHAIVSKIEQLFSELDKGIESLKTAQQQLKVYRQSVLKSAFEGKLTNHSGNISFRRLEEFTELITKGASPRWQGFNYIDDNSQLLFITSENVRENYLNISEPKYLPLGFNEIQKRSILKNDDVLFNLVGASIGRAAIFNLKNLSNINQAVAVIRLKEGLNNKYLTHFLNSEVAKQVYLSKIVEVARANLSLTDVANIQIPFCAIPEQHQIVQEIESRLSECDNMEATIAASLQQAEALRQSILKKAFEGRMLNDKELEAVRQDPTWEPAERLLERIRMEKAGLQPKKPGRKGKYKV